LKGVALSGKTPAYALLDRSGSHPSEKVSVGGGQV